MRYYRRHGAGAGARARARPAEQDVEQAWLHLTGITPALSASAREAVRHAAELASAPDTRVCFDLNYRSALWSADEAGPVLPELVKRADLVLATLDEARLLTGEPADDPVAAARALAALGPRTVVVKRGAEGAVAWRRRRRRTRCRRSPTTLVDPVGAGDAFAAGLLADLARGRSTVEALGDRGRCRRRRRLVPRRLGGAAHPGRARAAAGGRCPPLTRWAARGHRPDHPAPAQPRPGRADRAAAGCPGPRPRSPR